VGGDTSVHRACVWSAHPSKTATDGAASVVVVQTETSPPISVGMIFLKHHHAPDLRLRVSAEVFAGFAGLIWIKKIFRFSG
jgi:hypothetical protein